MAYRKEQWGVMPSGEAVTLYTLSNDNGVSASFTDLGGTWVTMNAVSYTHLTLPTTSRV